MLIFLLIIDIFSPTKELNNVDLRNKLYDTKMKQMEEELTPFGFIEDGIDDTYTVEGGEVWQIYN